MQKTLAVINLEKLRQNARYVRKILENRFFFAVVKADGYGHGGAQVALAIESIVDGFCVAIVDEGASLRLAGISKPVLVLTPPLGIDDVRRAKLYNLTLTVNSVKTARMIGDLSCHIKVNTGMNRLGCSIEELAQILNELNGGQIAGVYSHLYAPSNARESGRQLELFNCAEELVKAQNPTTVAHFAASGGILADSRYLKDGARCGILLYGYSPEGFSAEVQPILKVYARRTQITQFIGGGAGYSCAKRNYNSLSCYRLGYADGFWRSLPLGVSPLCMDAFIKEGGEELLPVLTDARQNAAQCGTISYEVLCSATRRSERIYEE